MTNRRVLILYGRAQCHLCHRMEEALRPLQSELGFGLEWVDVDCDAMLAARYGDRVPVLAASDGQELCQTFLDEGVVRRYLGQ